MKKVKVLLVLAVASLLSVSCLVDDEATELGGGDTTIVGFASASATPGFVTDGEEKQYSIAVNVIGGNEGLIPNSDITVSYEVDPSSTAVAGVNFDFVGGQSVVIPAGATTVNIPIKVYSGSLDSDADAVDPVLVLKLSSVTSSQNVIVGSNYQIATITLNGLCFSNLAGTYYYNYTSGPAYFDIVELSPGAYQAAAFPFFIAQYTFEFTDNCGVLTITGGFPFTNVIAGNGTVSEEGNLLWTNLSVSGLTNPIPTSITAFKAP
ncbi:MAG: hypothetical protein EOO88_27840 [Pedobacter sp.]|nr:MAG: hypothetical protein EOO88_27840 [Pedobacter sp.]